MSRPDLSRVPENTVTVPIRRPDDFEPGDYWDLPHLTFDKVKGSRGAYVFVRDDGTEVCFFKDQLEVVLAISEHHCNVTRCVSGAKGTYRLTVGGDGVARGGFGDQPVQFSSPHLASLAGRDLSVSFEVLPK